MGVSLDVDNRPFCPHVVIRILRLGIHADIRGLRDRSAVIEVALRGGALLPLSRLLHFIVAVVAVVL